MGRDADIELIASQVGIDVRKVRAVTDLFDAGSGVPFVTRYRSDETGVESEVIVQQVYDLSRKLQTLRNARDKIYRAFRELNHRAGTTAAKREEIRIAIPLIENATSVKELVALYEPFKKSVVTAAAKARELGFGRVADMLWEKRLSVDDSVFGPSFAPLHRDAQMHINNILISRVAHDPDIFNAAWADFKNFGILEVSKAASKGNKSEETKYRAYYSYRSRFGKVRAHQILAILRGTKQGYLKFQFCTNNDILLSKLIKASGLNRIPSKQLSRLLHRLLGEAITKSILPVVRRRLKSELKAGAVEVARKSFLGNLRHLLLRKPLFEFGTGDVPLGTSSTVHCAVLGIDPGFRHGSKLAVVSKSGDPLDTLTIYPHRREEAIASLKVLQRKWCCRYIALGTGQGARIALRLCTEAFSHIDRLQVYPISEDGVSVYSTTVLAQSELSNFSAVYRGAISIARRLIDPLSELVKVPPMSLGVGLYQHDLREKDLKDDLANVISSTVACVGVHVNTCSELLLSHVPGLGLARASAIMQYRKQHGSFRCRKDLLKVRGIGPKSFEQAAGFIRIPESEYIFEDSEVHPEAYEFARALIIMLGFPDTAMTRRVYFDTSSAGLRSLSRKVLADAPTLAALRARMEEKFGPGRSNLLRQVLTQLARIGIDPRHESSLGGTLSTALISQSLLREISQSPEVGSRFDGVVANVVNFGAFITFGIINQGLLHTTEMQEMKLEDLYVGKPITVYVKAIQQDGSGEPRISLSLGESRRRLATSGQSLGKRKRGT